MMKIKIHYIFLFFLLLSLTACKSDNLVPKNNTGYPTPAQYGYPSSAEEPQQTLNQGVEGTAYFLIPGENAFDALPIAYAKAKEWSDNAELFMIPRFRIMENNLNIPNGPSGWFFMFKDLNKSKGLEYYVQVIDGELSGFTEVQKIYFSDDTDPEYLPIDTSTKLLDISEIMSIFMENGGELIYDEKGESELDFQLVRLSGMDHPVWSIFDASKNEKPLLSIDAVNGKIADSPFIYE